MTQILSLELMSMKTIKDSLNKNTWQKLKRKKESSKKRWREYKDL